MDTPIECSAKKVYQTLMMWLDGKMVPPGNPLTLSIPLRPTSPNISREGADVDLSSPVVSSVIRFKKGVGMGGLVWADSLDHPGVRIMYDPNWDALDKLEAIIKGLVG
jgi:hypothetical protein